MPEALRQSLIRFFRVSETPTPPPGINLKTFRAAPNFFKYSLLGWFGQLLLIGALTLAAGLSFLGALNGSNDDPEALFVNGFFLFALGLSLISLFFKLLTLRLDYEFRWYMITDSGLRIREGIMSVHEITMAFKNIQNVTINQGPLQRLLGISDLVVQTAGGSTVATQGSQQQGVVSSHTGYFRGVDNAEEIRDMMMTRLRKVKGAGLNPEPEKRKPTTDSRGLSATSMAALREAAQEARLLSEFVRSR